MSEYYLSPSGVYQIGLSAMAIAGDGDAHPLDTGDLRRCINYCVSHNISTSELRERMKGRSEAWDLLLPEWDNLVQMNAKWYLKEDSVNVNRMIRRVLDKGTACQSCRANGRGEPCKKCKATGRRGGGICRAQGCRYGYMRCHDCGGRGYTTEES